MFANLYNVRLHIAVTAICLTQVLRHTRELGLYTDLSNPVGYQCKTFSLMTLRVTKEIVTPLHYDIMADTLFVFTKHLVSVAQLFSVNSQQNDAD